MTKRVFALLLALVLCGTLALSVSADIVDMPEPEFFGNTDTGLSSGLLVVIIAAVVINAVAALVLILVFVKKK